MRVHVRDEECSESINPDDQIDQRGTIVGSDSSKQRFAGSFGLSTDARGAFLRFS